jgi:hypothetical protein
MTAMKIDVLNFNYKLYIFIKYSYFKYKGLNDTYYCWLSKLLTVSDSLFHQEGQSIDYWRDATLSKSL